MACHDNDCKDIDSNFNFKGTFRRKKYLGMFTYPISYCKNMKMAGYIRLKLCVRVVVDDAPMGTCNFEN